MLEVEVGLRHHTKIVTDLCTWVRRVVLSSHSSDGELALGVHHAEGELDMRYDQVDGDSVEQHR